MALTVETGAGVPGADSYVATVDAQAFVDARGLSVTMTDGLLLRAMDALAPLSYVGTAVEGNPLPWPRTGKTISGEELSSSAVPNGVVRAQIWMAYYIDSGSDPATPSTPEVRKEVVDVIETEYAVRLGRLALVEATALPNVSGSLKGLVRVGGVIDRA